MLSITQTPSGSFIELTAKTGDLTISDANSAFNVLGCAGPIIEGDVFPVAAAVSGATAPTSGPPTGGATEVPSRVPSEVPTEVPPRVP
ncbi:hypothetical protein PSACC_01743, partial [Paramicrosporidium saccamoebae]